MKHTLTSKNTAQTWSCDTDVSPAHTTNTLLGGAGIQEMTTSADDILERHGQERSTQIGTHAGSDRPSIDKSGVECGPMWPCGFDPIRGQCSTKITQMARFTSAVVPLTA